MAQISKNINIQTQDDLKKVDFCLRNLYHTQVGQPCQYLLTSAYQKWQLQVRSHLQLRKDSSTEDTKIVPIDTYLPNYHIMFFNNTVQIDFIRPHLYKQKRKRESE